MDVENVDVPQSQPVPGSTLMDVDEPIAHSQSTGETPGRAKPRRKHRRCVPVRMSFTMITPRRTRSGKRYGKRSSIRAPLTAIVNSPPPPVQQAPTESPPAKAEIELPGTPQALLEVVPDSPLPALMETPLVQVTEQQPGPSQALQLLPIDPNLEVSVMDETMSTPCRFSSIGVAAGALNDQPNLLTRLGVSLANYASPARSYRPMPAVKVREVASLATDDVLMETDKPREDAVDLDNKNLETAKADVTGEAHPVNSQLPAPAVPDSSPAAAVADGANNIDEKPENEPSDVANPGAGGDGAAAVPMELDIVAPVKGSGKPTTTNNRPNRRRDSVFPSYTVPDSPEPDVASDEHQGHSELHDDEEEGDHHKHGDDEEEDEQEHSQDEGEEADQSSAPVASGSADQPGPSGLQGADAAQGERPPIETGILKKKKGRKLPLVVKLDPTLLCPPPQRSCLKEVPASEEAVKNKKKKGGKKGPRKPAIRWVDVANKEPLCQVKVIIEERPLRKVRAFGKTD